MPIPHEFGQALKTHLDSRRTPSAAPVSIGMPVRLLEFIAIAIFFLALGVSASAILLSLVYDLFPTWLASLCVFTSFFLLGGLGIPLLRLIYHRYQILCMHPYVLRTYNIRGVKHEFPWEEIASIEPVLFGLRLNYPDT